MLSNRTKAIVGFIGTAILFIFIIGLAHSISTGFAGISGGMPFTIIVFIVLSMAAYDYWDECVRKK